MDEHAAPPSNIHTTGTHMEGPLPYSFEDLPLRALFRISEFAVDTFESQCHVACVSKAFQLACSRGFSSLRMNRRLTESQWKSLQQALIPLAKQLKRLDVSLSNISDEELQGLLGHLSQVKLLIGFRCFRLTAPTIVNSSLQR